MSLSTEDSVAAFFDNEVSSAVTLIASMAKAKIEAAKGTKNGIASFYQAPVDFSKVFGPQDEEPVKRRRAARSSSSSSSSSSGSDSSDSDSSDLDTEDEAARAKKAAYDAKTAANVAKEQSTVIFDIKPEDTDVDLDELAQSIYGVNCEGLEWGREHQIIPLAFGLKMLKVACIIRNVLVSTDWMEETISELPGVGSVEIAAFNKI